MPTSDFAEILVLSPISGEANADAHESIKVAYRISLKNKMSLNKFQVIRQPYSVVCLKGGERGTFLGPPLLGPPSGVPRIIFFIFGEKRIIHLYNVLQSRS